jgi:hypothetical protein
MNVDELDEECQRLVELTKKDRLLRMMRKTFVCVTASTAQVIDSTETRVELGRRIVLALCVQEEDTINRNKLSAHNDTIWTERDEWKILPTHINSFLEGKYKSLNDELHKGIAIINFPLHWEADVFASKKAQNLPDYDILIKLVKNRLASMEIPVRDFGFQSFLHAFKMLGVEI